MDLPTLSAIDAELIERDLDRLSSFAEFVRAAWHVVEPGVEYVHGKHIDAICDHLQAIADGQIDKLLINIPPRHGKSKLVSVLWPAWLWTHSPSTQIMSSSYAAELAERDTRGARLLIQSQWYQRRWGHLFNLSRDQNRKMRYDNDRNGQRLAVSVGSSATGEGYDIGIVDDPNKPVDMHSPTKREAVISWYRETWSTRANNPKTSAEVIIMQRLHQRDLSGFVLEMGTHEHLMLPARYESARKYVTSVSQDWRKTDGELLWPELKDEQAMQTIAKPLGPYGVAGQLQQRPSPESGSIVKSHWLRYWYPVDGRTYAPVVAQDDDGNRVDCVLRELPEAFDQVVLSWDCAQSTSQSADYTVGVAIGRIGSARYLLDMVRGQWDYVQLCAQFEAFCRRWQQAGKILVEEKSNGAALVSQYRDKVSGLIPVTPTSNKMQRLHDVLPSICSDLMLPHHDIPGMQWAEDVTAELVTFPAAAHDDIVDAITQALANTVSEFYLI